MVYTERIKPFPRPRELARVSKDKITILSDRERVNEILLGLALTVTPRIAGKVDLGFGRQVVGDIDVAGREDEDAKIGIDIFAEDIAKEKLKKLGLTYNFSFFVFSEHQNFKVKGKNADAQEITGVMDPYDNSDENARGIDTPGHFVFAFYDLDGNPLGAVDSNTFTQHISINRNGKNYVYNPKMRIFQETPIPPAIKTIRDPRFAYASYFGRDKYSRPFNDNFDALSKNRHPKSTFHPKGGAHIYEQMARGAIHAYIMFNEPISEIFQGLPFALSAGFVALSVKPDGNYENIKFNPKYYLTCPERYSEDRIPLLVVARTIQLAGEIIRYAYPNCYQI